MTEKRHIPGFVYKLMLLAATIIWGFAFVVMKDAVDVLPPAQLIGVRFFLTGLLMAAVFHRSLAGTLNGPCLKAGLVLAAVTFLAFWVQTVGLADTTPGKNAFLTATYCVFVPFFWWLVSKRRPGRYNLAAALLCLCGMGLVSLQSDLRIGRGEGLTILSGVFYALHIIATASAARGRSPVLLSFAQFAVAAVLSWVTAPFSAPAPEVIPVDVWLRLGYLCVMCTGLCFLLQTFGQKYTPPTTAALLLTLESVFGTLFSVAFYHEQLEPRVLVGFALILVAIVLSETKLKFLRRRTA